MAALKLYTKQNCPSCLQVKRLLSYLQVGYEECRTDEVEAYRSHVLELGFRSLPILEREGGGAVLASDQAKLMEFLVQTKAV